MLLTVAVAGLICMGEHPAHTLADLVVHALLVVVLALCAAACLDH